MLVMFVRRSGYAVNHDVFLVDLSHQKVWVLYSIAQQECHAYDEVHDNFLHLKGKSELCRTCCPVKYANLSEAYSLGEKLA